MTPDSSFPDLLELLGSVFSLVFIFWPLILLGALRGRGRLLPQMLVIWSFLAVGRLLLSSNPILLSSFIIPEPYNTIAFFATGAVLWGISIGKRLLGQRSLRRAGDSAHSPSDLFDLSATQFEEMVVEFTELRDTGQGALELQVTMESMSSCRPRMARSG